MEASLMKLKHHKQQNNFNDYNKNLHKKSGIAKIYIVFH